MSRVIGLDVGNRRIGIAISDELRSHVQPYATLTRTNRRNDIRYFQRLQRLRPFSDVVVGLPLYPSGDHSPQAEKSTAFADELRAELQVTVHLWDERLSTAEAHRYLDATGRAKTDRKSVVDQVAAVLILQSWLDARGALAS